MMGPSGRSNALQTLDALAVEQPPTTRKVKVEPKEWGTDDMNGNVDKAERELFRRLLKFLQGGRNIPTLFRRMNINEDGRLSSEEWAAGVRAVTGCEMTDYMLNEIFERMDGCDDASSDLISPDECLSYSELCFKVMEYQRLFRLEGWMKSPYWGRSMTPASIRPRSARSADPTPPGTVQSSRLEWYTDADGNWFEMDASPKTSRTSFRPSTAGSKRSLRSPRKSPRKVKIVGRLSMSPTVSSGPWSPAGYGMTGERDSFRNSWIPDEFE